MSFMKLTTSVNTLTEAKVYFKPEKTYKETYLYGNNYVIYPLGCNSCTSCQHLITHTNIQN